MKKDIPMRSSPEFQKMVKEIQLEEMKRGKLISQRRITLAMTRVPGLKDLILNMGIKNDRQ